MNSGGSVSKTDTESHTIERQTHYTKKGTDLKKENNYTKAWEEYEAGVEYKRRIGLYSRVRENERFYRGDQWAGINSGDLPTPVFNVIKRVINFMISSVTSQPVSICYSDESLFCAEETEYKRQRRSGIELLNKNAAYRYDKCKMESLVRSALLDAAISGNGVFYTYWDSECKTGQPFDGDIKTVLCDSVNLFVANVSSDDIQSQDYVMISGRDSVSHLQKEAAKNHVPAADIAKISADKPEGRGAGELFDIESGTEQNCTYLMKFFRNEQGYVVWQKSVKSTVIAERTTELRRYPVAVFAWEKAKGSFIGNAPVSSLTENQKYINKAYAMVMKHMTDTAFSKVIYDKSLIPEWSNEVGEAIGVRGGGDVRSAAAVIGTGTLQSGFLEVISMTVAHTKELMGATDTALGEVDPQNTSAIIALQEASDIPLENIRQNLYAALEDVALNWAEMILAYCPVERILPYRENGEEKSGYMPDGKAFKDSLIAAKIDIGTGTRYSQVVSLNTLDKLLAGGYITVEQYLQRLPAGIVPESDLLAEQLAQMKGNTDEQQQTNTD